MYFGWYKYTGRLEFVNASLINAVTSWRQRFNVPIMITEYGAEAICSLESLPSVSFTTNYQNGVIIENHKALDNLRSSKIITVEMTWTFADFMTNLKF